MQPLVSFILPSYNHARFIAEGLASIFHQTMPVEYEVIVVDDASGDNTGEMVRACGNARVTYVRNAKNQGNAATISRALTLTRGIYIAQLDADDRFRPDFLEMTLPIFSAHPNLAMVYGDVAAMDEAGQVYQDPWENHHARRLHHGRAFLGNEFVLMLMSSPSSATARLMRGDLARAEAPFPAYVEGRFTTTEWFLNLRLARYHDVYYIPRTLADYRIHPQNLHTQPLVGHAQERTIIQILDHAFAESDALRQPGLKPRAYGKAYLQLGDSYFSDGKFPDARRCYLYALRWQPRQFLRNGGLHRLIGTALGETRYARVKSRVRNWLAPMQ